MNRVDNNTVDDGESTCEPSSINSSAKCYMLTAENHQAFPYVRAMGSQV